jgi:hypothetical protein
MIACSDDAKKMTRYLPLTPIAVPFLFLNGEISGGYLVERGCETELVAF